MLLTVADASGWPESPLLITRARSKSYSASG